MFMSVHASYIGPKLACSFNAANAFVTKTQVFIHQINKTLNFVTSFRSLYY